MLHAYSLIAWKVLKKCSGRQHALAGFFLEIVNFRKSGPFLKKMHLFGRMEMRKLNKWTLQALKGSLVGLHHFCE